jgi:cobalt-zinc-cadmium efflux system protein
VSHTHAEHGQADPLAGINTAFLIAVCVNIGFTILEVVYALLAHSASLLADAGHNLSDVSGLLLAWGASYLAGKKASAMYSYGFRRTTILAAIINALVLVFASAIIAFDSIDKFMHPVAMHELPVMIVAAIGVLVNAGTALLFMKGSREDLNIKAAFLHLAYDALISAGVVITAVLIYFTGIHWLDPMMGLIIVLVILAGTWGVLRDSVNLILDAVPEHIDQAEVEAYLRGIDGVTDIHDVHIWGMSTRESGLTAHLVMPRNTLWESQGAYLELSEEMKRRFRIHHVTLQVERDDDCTNEDCCN